MAAAGSRWGQGAAAAAQEQAEGAKPEKCQAAGLRHGSDPQIVDEDVLIGTTNAGRETEVPSVVSGVPAKVDVDEVGVGIEAGGDKGHCARDGIVARGHGPAH